LYFADNGIRFSATVIQQKYCYKYNRF